MIVYNPLSAFWKEIYPAGMTAQDIDKELSDLEFVADQLGKVYSHLTGGVLSKPMYYAEVINSLHDDYITDIVNEHLEEQKEVYDADIKYLQNKVHQLETKLEKYKAKALK
jgi:chaperonin cofactor prefoldin